MDYNCETVSENIFIQIKFVTILNIFRQFFQEWHDFAPMTRAGK